MKLKRLTKRENQVMETFWKYNDRALSSNDIVTLNLDISKNTLMPILRKLYENGFIDVAGIGFTKNSVTREYKAVVSQAEYISVFLEDSTSCEIAKNYIKKISDINKLKEIEEIINKRKLELESV